MILQYTRGVAGVVMVTLSLQAMEHTDRSLLPQNEKKIVPQHTQPPLSFFRNEIYNQLIDLRKQTKDALRKKYDQLHIQKLEIKEQKNIKIAPFETCSVSSKNIDTTIRKQLFALDTEQDKIYKIVKELVAADENLGVVKNFADHRLEILDDFNLENPEEWVILKSDFFKNKSLEQASHQEDLSYPWRVYLESHDKAGYLCPFELTTHCIRDISLAVFNSKIARISMGTLLILPFVLPKKCPSYQ